MTRSYTRIYIHYIWIPKYRRKILVKEVRERIQKHIREYCQQLNLRVLAIGGYDDHLHLLIEQPATRSISAMINLIKGESSHWINSNSIFPYKFTWQKRYAAFSVSPAEVKRVKAYIQKQEEHHCPIVHDGDKGSKS